MRTITNLMLVALLGTSLLPVGMGTAAPEFTSPSEVHCNGETVNRVDESPGQIEYAITHDKSAQRVCVVAENTGTQKGLFGYSIWVDGKRVLSTDTKELMPGDNFRENWTITGGVDATRDNHSIVVDSYGNSVRFNFTKEINPLNESGVPTPHIEGLVVKRNGTKSGQPNIIVDIENEGSRNYNPEAVVKTFQSNLRWMLRRGSLKGTHRTRLNEGKDDIIIGTVKLYGDTYYTGTKWDRVSFVSYPNGTYETWEPKFGEIPTNREVESRQIYYENETAREKYRGPDVDPISERASKLGAVLVVALFVGVLWYRRRRKPR